MGDGNEGHNCWGLPQPSVNTHFTAASGLGRKTQAQPVRARTDGAQGPLGTIRARVVLSKDLRVEFPTKSRPSWPRAWGLADVVDIAGQVLVRRFLKFCIYIPKLGNTISMLAEASYLLF
ncbi:unnamed protein product [Rangifer tarandus platyrhynchus]|uniref:Uncharacterized protein n=2 Tax=Rangifer tarandus platyrhynchus TaxID=3082113 RepID=A0ABN8XZ80_RANTA|nr:unnamed protein product [Rangifer tarandus platyrhynchus]